MMDFLFVLPPAQIVVSNILSVIVIFFYLGFQALIAYLQARRQRITGLPPPPRTLSRSREYISGVFIAVNICYLLEQPLYANVRILFRPPWLAQRIRLTIWGIISLKGWYFALGTMRPRVFQHLWPAVALIHFQVCSVVLRWRSDRVKIAEVDIDILSTTAKLLREPVGVATNLSLVLACCCLGVYHLSSYLPRTSRRSTRYVLSDFLPGFLYAEGWASLGRVLVIFNTSVLTWRVIAHIEPKTDNMLRDLLVLCVFYLAWAFMISTHVPYLYGYLAPAVGTIHSQIAFRLLWLKQDAIHVDGLSNDVAIVEVILLVLLVSLVVLATQVRHSHNRQDLLDQDTQTSYGTFNESPFVIVNDVEAALPRFHGLLSNDEVSPFTTVANNATHNATRLLPTENGTPGGDYETLPDPEDHTGSSAATAIYVGPSRKVKYQDELSDVLDDEEEAERVDTPVRAGPISTSYVRDVVAAFNKAPSPKSDSASAQVTVRQNQGALSGDEFQPGSSSQDTHPVHTDPTSDRTVPMDELSVTPMPCTHIEQHQVSSTSAAGADKQASKAAAFFRQTRARPRSRNVSGNSSSSTATGSHANTGRSSKIPVVQIPKLKRSRAKAKAKARRNEARSEPGGTAVVESVVEQDENVKQRQVSAPAGSIDYKGKSTTIIGLTQIQSVLAQDH